MVTTVETAAAVAAAATIAVEAAESITMPRRLCTNIKEEYTTPRQRTMIVYSLYFIVGMSMILSMYYFWTQIVIPYLFNIVLPLIYCLLYRTFLVCSFAGVGYVYYAYYPAQAPRFSLLMSKLLSWMVTAITTAWDRKKKTMTKKERKNEEHDHHRSTRRGKIHNTKETIIQQARVDAKHVIDQQSCALRRKKKRLLSQQQQQDKYPSKRDLAGLTNREKKEIFQGYWSKNAEFL